MKASAYLLFVSVLLAAMGDLSARSFRVSQLPNGSKFGCTNCHTGFGGPRNDFGKAVGSGFLDNSGNTLWGPALAALDSDGDGVSNGAELQDPLGQWKVGDPNPGDPALVSNPGDPTSTTAVRLAEEFPQVFLLRGNAPNPFNPSTTLTLELPQPAEVRLDVFNPRGERVCSLVNGSLPAGVHRIAWNGTDDGGLPVASGIYLARFEAPASVQTVRMLLLR